MSTTFTSLGLPERIVRALADRKINEPFPVQSAAIPHGLAGRDIQGRAPTGSGKTLAFGLPMLSTVPKAGSNRPKALVLAPTRELAEQIKKDLAPLAKAAGRSVEAIYGGVGYGPQQKALRTGVDVLVATPGRLEDLIERRNVVLNEVEIVVIDEADRMADMGFFPAVRRILDQTRRDRQTLLFSATLDGDVAALSRQYQVEPVTVSVEPVGDQEIDVLHHFWRVDRANRTDHTAELIAEAGRSIVFTRTRHGADRLVRQLAKAGVSAVAMHGGRSQNQRTRALKAFSTGKANALVATDVAARGIHVDGVDAVIHYDLAGDKKDYLHRSGRTARAGATGTVITLVIEGQDREVERLQRDLGLQAPIRRPDLALLRQGGQRLGSGQGPQEADRKSRPARAPSAPPKETSESIFVGNLPWKTTDGELEELFAGFGEVRRVEIVTQGKSGRSKGYGFVDMPEHQRRIAIDGLDGHVVGGRRLTVRQAR
jgi:superfamily II DNA/RNA helicase